MVTHIVSWSFADGFSPEENREHVLKIKEGLERLPGIIDGIVELKVHVDVLSSSNRDAVLYSVFRDEESLKAYRVHPEHKKVSEYVHTVMKDRVCLDYTI